MNPTTRPRAAGALFFGVTLVVTTAPVGCGDGRLDTGPDAALRCELSETYTWIEASSSLGFDGTTMSGLSTMTLTPPAGFEFEFSSSTLPSTSCSTPLPSCGDSLLTDVSDIEAAIAHPDVQAALAQPKAPEYMRFAVDAAGGGSFSHTGKLGFSVDYGYCGAAPAPACVEPPPGITALLDVLRGVGFDQRSSCAAAEAGTAN
jgi:hypothetical protein